MPITFLVQLDVCVRHIAQSLDQAASMHESRLLQRFADRMFAASTAVKNTSDPAVAFSLIASEQYRLIAAMNGIDKESNPNMDESEFLSDAVEWIEALISFTPLSNIRESGKHPEIKVRS